jgi:endonuclease YncB( thermonuclease family)
LARAAKASKTAAARLGARLLPASGIILRILAFFAVGVSAIADPGRPGSCPVVAPAESATLAKVVDGDTLLLSDGRRVRLIGVNTPELEHDGSREEPGAQQAAGFASAFLGRQPLGLVPGASARDRYGRTLAHVYSDTGASLEEALLGAGLARQIVVPPNTALADCLARAEQQARAANSGLWGSGVFLPRATATLTPGESGFRLLRGRVSAVGKSASNWWVELDNHVALRVDRADYRYFDWQDVAALEGRYIEVRGWLVWRGDRSRGHPPWLMRLRHPLSLRPVAG